MKICLTNTLASYIFEADMRSLKVGQMKSCFISVDIEATGPTPGKYGMYEIGACVLGGDEYFERKFTLLTLAGISSPALQAVHTTEAELHLRQNLVSPELGMCEFAQWVSKVAVNATPIFVANNAPFDWMFVAWYFEEFGVKNPFGHSALDMKAYFMGMTGCSWMEATLANMAKYAGIEFATLPHRALEDARIQGNIIHALINRNKEGK